MNNFTTKRLYVGDSWFEATRTELFTWFGNPPTIEIIQISGEGENTDREQRQYAKQTTRLNRKS